MTSGFRVFRAYPSIAVVALPSNGLHTLQGTGATLYQFKVTAMNGPIGIEKFTFRLATSSTGGNIGIDNINLTAYSDSGFSTLFTSGIGTNGKVQPSDNITTTETGTTNGGPAWKSASTNLPIFAGNGSGSSAASTTVQIQSGGTLYFALKGDITVGGGVTAANATAKLMGDAAYPGLSTGVTCGVTPSIMGKANDDGCNFSVKGDANNFFIWTPFSTTTITSVNAFDYTNGYGVFGIPSPAASAETSSY